MPFEAASKLPVLFSPPLELFDLGHVGVAVQLVPLLRGSRSTVHLLRTLLTTCDINHLTRNLKLKRPASTVHRLDLLPLSGSVPAEL